VVALACESCDRCSRSLCSAPAHLVERISDAALNAWKQMSVSVEHGYNAAVPGPTRDFRWAGASGDPQGDCGVAHVVTPKGCEPGGGHGGRPHASAPRGHT
jgi:hypothetical protein